MYNLKSQELNLDNYFTKRFCGRASVFFTFNFGICQDLELHLELQVALTGRKKPVLGQKKAANNFFEQKATHVRISCSKM
jgi:hypothetical protein